MNTIAGWVLGACGVALGLSIAGNMMFEAEAPEKPGFPIEATDDSAGGGAAEIPIGAMMAVADSSHGAEVFKKCTACHTINQGGANGIGPNLYATVGEGIAEGKGGFGFSDALKSKGGKWDFEALNAWLTSPRKYAPGTKMTFAGLSDPKDRADVILYLNSQGSNMPLPAAPATAGATPADKPADPGGSATPGASNLSEAATPASGAPSQDPAAKK